MGDPPLPPASVDALFARILTLPPGPAIPWFLDVDGVLNLEISDQSSLGDWPTYECAVVMTSTQPAVPFTWAPALVDCLNLLVECGQVEIRWLTSWGLDAPICAAPAIGLQVGRRVAEESAHSDKTSWWKLQVVQQFAATGDFCVWTDDYLDEEIGSVLALPDGGVLALCPVTARGLTPEHLNLIIDAIFRRRLAPRDGSQGPSS